MKKEINSQKSTSNVLFSLPVSVTKDANSAIVVGDFSEWNPIALNTQKDGSFAVEIEIPLGREYHFRYQIDGHRWENDATADRYETSPVYGHIENSVLSLIAIQPKSVVVKTKTTAPKEVIQPIAKVVAKEKVATVKKTTENVKVVPKAVTKAVAVEIAPKKTKEKASVSKSK